MVPARWTITSARLRLRGRLPKRPDLAQSVRPSMNATPSLDMFRLDGKSCIVTGAGSGIGLAISELFVQAGGTVFMAEINKSAAEQASRLRDGGGKAHAVETDVA